MRGWEQNMMSEVGFMEETGSVYVMTMACGC